jgi:hypothetical protein
MAEKTIIKSAREPLNPIIVEVPFKDKITAKFTLLDYAISYEKVAVTIKLKEELIHEDGSIIREKVVTVIRKNEGAQIQYDLDEELQIIEGTGVTIIGSISPVTDFVEMQTGEQTISDIGNSMIGEMVQEYLAAL